MNRFRLVVEYDGTDFQGWQLQAQGRSVQGALEEAITRVTAESRRVMGAGRTDAGVHARGQCAHFDSETRLAETDLRRAINAVLPSDVAVSELEQVSPSFHARSDVVSKTYSYRILNRTVPSPLRRNWTWHLRAPLDVAAMQEAAKLLVGDHDFAAFRGARGGSDPEERTRRTLDRLDLAAEADEVRLTAVGRSFLRYMVRNLVGTLVEVGQGQRSAADVEAVLASGERSRAGPTAPPQGLCLERVRYREPGTR
jgi:tRNA pseudouridine38-40 synthase